MHDSTTSLFLSAANPQHEESLTEQLETTVEQPHQSAAFILMIDRDKERFLFLRRSADSYFPLCWDLPGGFAEPGETVDEAAKREAMEEIGLNPPDLIPWANYDHTPKTLDLNFTVFIRFIDGDMHPTLNHEHDKAEWLSRDEVQHRLQSDIDAQWKPQKPPIDGYDAFHPSIKHFLNHEFDTLIEQIRSQPEDQNTITPI
ncbi:MAG: NUDIX hydrolase [Alphaproteobacteria bacterium]